MVVFCLESLLKDPNAHKCLPTPIQWAHVNYDVGGDYNGGARLSTIKQYIKNWEKVKVTLKADQQQAKKLAQRAASAKAKVALEVGKGGNAKKDDSPGEQELQPPDSPLQPGPDKDGGRDEDAVEADGSGGQVSGDGSNSEPEDETSEREQVKNTADGGVGADVIEEEGDRDDDVSVRDGADGSEAEGSEGEGSKKRVRNEEEDEERATKKSKED
eukprot:comp23946_c0_seq1/m.42349 comp23946_c0_seq1/g.42349  ORF comp23946_c0_seq1/g.42349 comp23946_c0_seq1/m.42349 type:complete len:215 (-) comp23946_c0_seq1:40-684(-)